MSRIPTFKRIYKTDYPPEQQDLVDKLSFSINIGFESVNGALNNAISLQDNVQCTVKSFNIEVDSTGKPKSASTFTLTSAGKLTGIMVLSAVNQTNSTVYPTATPFISFNVNSTLVSILNVSGLPANNVFFLTIVAFTN